jgi:hypothetical protein
LRADRQRPADEFGPLRHRQHPVAAAVAAVIIRATAAASRAAALTA